LLIEREPAEVTEVLDVEVRGHGADERGGRVERVREGVRSTHRHGDARAGLHVDVSAPDVKRSLPCVTMKISS